MRSWLGLFCFAAVGCGASSVGDGGVADASSFDFAVASDLATSIDLAPARDSAIDGGAMGTTQCFVIDPPTPDCICASWWRHGVGGACNPIGEQCAITQDQLFEGSPPLYMCTVECGPKGTIVCVSGPCDCIVDYLECTPDMGLP